MPGSFPLYPFPPFSKPQAEPCAPVRKLSCFNSLAPRLLYVWLPFISSSAVRQSLSIDLGLVHIPLVPGVYPPGVFASGALLIYFHVALSLAPFFHMYYINFSLVSFLRTPFLVLLSLRLNLVLALFFGDLLRFDRSFPRSPLCGPLPALPGYPYFSPLRPEPYSLQESFCSSASPCPVSSVLDVPKNASKNKCVPGQLLYLLVSRDLLLKIRHCEVNFSDSISSILFSKL